MIGSESNDEVTEGWECDTHTPHLHPPPSYTLATHVTLYREGIHKELDKCTAPNSIIELTLER